MRALDTQLGSLEASFDPERGSIGIDVIIETARGFLRMGEILLASPRVQSVIFAPLDFAASLGMTGTVGHAPSSTQQDALNAVRLAILIGGRSSGVAVIDGPYFRLGDDTGLRRETRAAAELGFYGKMSIHPDQIHVLNEVFTPTQAEFDRALAVLDACREAESSGLGAICFERAMIDEATRKLAEATATRGHRAGLVRSLAT